MKNSVRYNKQSNIVGYILFGLSVMAAIIIINMGMGEDIWYDEVFSLIFADGSYSDIINMTAKDVHPPFYYFYLKFMIDIMLRLIPDLHYITAAKIAAFIPLVGIYMLALVPIRKKYGMGTAGLFALLITAMPQVNTYYVEIRMYSLALLLVTTAIICALFIVKGGDGDRKKRGLWLLLWLAGVATAYTQYFACISIAGIYLCLIAWSIVEKRRKELQMALLAVVLSIAAFLPWISILAAQLKGVSQGYWIAPMTIRSLAGCVKFIFLPTSGTPVMNYLLAVLMIASLVITLILWAIAHREELKGKIIFFMLCISPVLLVIAAGYAFSLAGSPIFVYRYMIPATGGIYLLLAVAVNENLHYSSLYTWGMAAVIICFCMGVLYSMKGFYGEESKKLAHSREAVEIIRSIDGDTAVLTNFDHVAAVCSYYLRENEVLLYEWENTALIEEMLPCCRGNVTADEISHRLSNGEKVVFLGSFNSRDDILEDFGKMGISNKETGSYLLERYWFNYYELYGTYSQ